MIARLSGTVYATRPSYLTLDVHGVGYKVYATERLLSSLTAGDSCSLATHLAVREDALDLFGFPSDDELELFRLLIGISGIGPRSALAILGLETPEKLVRAIAQGDVGYLTKVSGVGKKSAEKIVLELRDKVQTMQIADAHPLQLVDADVLEALLSLGYRADEAREALRTLPPTLTDQGARVKEALRTLSRG